MFKSNISKVFNHFFFNVSLLKLKKLYMMYSYSSVYYINLSYLFNSQKLWFDAQTKTIMSLDWYFSETKGWMWKILKKYLKQFFVLTFAKIKYKGKGYKLYLKNKNRLHLQFGFSHKVYAYTYTSVFFFLMKGKLIFFNYCRSELYKFLYKFIRLKYINIFTIRGLRLSRQFIFKKTGKVSAYR